MSPRVHRNSAPPPEVLEDDAPLRQQLQRRTQQRLQARRGQTARLHEQALIREAQHAEPHAVHSENARVRRQQLQARLNRQGSGRHAPQPGASHASHPARAPAHDTLAQSHPMARHDAIGPDSGSPVPAWLSDQRGGGRGGSGGQESDSHPQDGLPENGDDTHGRGGKAGIRGARRRIGAGAGALPAVQRTERNQQTHRTSLPASVSLQTLAERHHRDVLTRDVAMAQSWVQALLEAITRSSPRQSIADNMLACQDDLLAAWQRHGEHFPFAGGALLRQFLPFLHASAPPADGGSGRPYALLPLMLLSGYRYRTPEQLKDARARIQNQRLARQPKQRG